MLARPLPCAQQLQGIGAAISDAGNLNSNVQALLDSISFGTPLQ
jgi:hypothetical protein